MNLYNQDEYYQLTNEVVNCLEQWPLLSAAQRERAVSIEVAMQAFHDAGACYWPDTLPDGQYDMRGFDLSYRYKQLERNSVTAAHVLQARAELAALVQDQRDVAR
jgi:hypothetical protein